MTSPTIDKVKAGTANRSQTDKLSDFYTSKDFKGKSDGVTDDTAAINSGVSFLKVLGGGVLIILPNTVYTESSVSMDSSVVLIEFHKSGKIRYLVKDEGATLPVTKGGVEIKTQGKDGVLLSSHDSGVAGFPYLRLLESVTGQLASIYSLNSLVDGYIELQELSVPNAPAVNKGRLFLIDDGTGKTQLCVRFNTGAYQVLTVEGRTPYTSYLEATATYDPASLTNGTGATTTVAVTGAALGDMVEVSFSLDLQGITVTAYVSAANTVSVRFQNQTDGTIDLGSGTIKVRVLK